VPTLHEEDGYRFYVWSNEHMPPHVHVEKDSAWAKLNVETGRITESKGVKGRKRRKIERIFKSNSAKIKAWWQATFGS
jgi:Domain of unknown function (DUF4160)